MITTTIGEILDDTDETENHDEPLFIYVIRDGDLVLYVGKSDGPVTDRIKTHCGAGLWSWAQGPSRVGQLIADNTPESRLWQVDLLSLKDCTPAVKAAYPMYHHWDVSDAERAMIELHRPCLNVTHNPEPRELPEKYKPYQAEREAAELKAVMLLRLPWGDEGPEG